MKRLPHPPPRRRDLPDRDGEPGVRAFATEFPRGFLRHISGGAIPDKVQRAPNLLSCLHSLAESKLTLMRSCARQERSH